MWVAAKALLATAIGLTLYHNVVPSTTDSTVALQWTFVHFAGYLPDGNDAQPPAEMTLAQATSTCDEDDTCMGFTYADPPAPLTSLRRRLLGLGLGYQPAPTLPVYFKVYFKTAAEAMAGAGWSTWLKRAPPAHTDTNFTVDGLTVQVGGAGTVLVLSPTYDPMPPYNFSFVPPLSAPGRPNRAVPRCQHLGDLTIRLRPAAATTATTATAATAAAAAAAAVPWAMYSSAAAGPSVKVRLHACVPSGSRLAVTPRIHGEALRTMHLSHHSLHVGLAARRCQPSTSRRKRCVLRTTSPQRCRRRRRSHTRSLCEWCGRTRRRQTAEGW